MILMLRPAHFVVAFFACSGLGAATLEQLSMDQMALKATSVVRARVTGSYTSTIQSTIYTHYTLQISEVWKGAAANEVLLPGGLSNGIRQSFPGVPDLPVDSEYVLFLWKSSVSGITHLVGLSQGLLSVNHLDDGTVIASRPKIGEMMLDAAGRKVADQPVSMKIADLKSRVRQPNAAAGLAR